jgi:hypothetical protein
VKEEIKVDLAALSKAALNLDKNEIAIQALAAIAAIAD